MISVQQGASSAREERTIEFPAPAVRWLVQNTGSNVELAVFSNVCQQWREIVARCILGEEEEDEKRRNNNMGNKSTKDAPSAHPFQSILLPSMVRKLQSEKTGDSTLSTEDFAKSSATKLLDDETCCLAWFHPDGIEYLQLPADGDDDDYFQDDDAAEARRYSSTWQPAESRFEGSQDGMESFVPVVDEEISYAISNENDNEDRRKTPGHSRRSRRSRSPTPLTAYTRESNRNRRENDAVAQEHNKEVVSCMYQWNGYSQPMEVLQPFGYSPTFVRRLLERATAVTLKRQSQEKEEERPALSAFSSASTLSARDGQPMFPSWTTMIRSKHRTKWHAEPRSRTFWTSIKSLFDSSTIAPRLISPLLLVTMPAK